MNINPLIEELKKPEYQGKSDIECVDMVNAKTVVVRRPVSAALLKQRCIERGFWSDLQLSASDSSDTIDKRKVALEVLGWLNDTRSQLDLINLDEPTVQAIMIRLYQFGFIPMETLTELQALPNATITWCESVGLGKEIGLGLVINARRAI
jgi:hypothetical protein